MKRSRGDLGGAGRRRLGQRVIGARHQPQPILEQRRHVQRRRDHRPRGEADVDGAVEDVDQRLVGARRGAERQQDARVLADERLEERREQVDERLGRGGGVDLAGRRRRGRAALPGEAVEIVEDARHLRQRPLAEAGEPHDAPAAHEQRLTELVLERANLPADRRLGQVQALRGAREALRLGDGAKRAQLRELHVTRPFPFVRALLRGCPTQHAPHADPPLDSAQCGPYCSRRPAIWRPPPYVHPYPRSSPPLSRRQRLRSDAQLQRLRSRPERPHRRRALREQGRRPVARQLRAAGRRARLPAAPRSRVPPGAQGAPGRSGAAHPPEAPHRRPDPHPRERDRRASSASSTSSRPRPRK